MDLYRMRLVPLGGTGEVTKNMYVYELHKGDQIQDILIVDCGIGFPREKELGIDLVLPDVSYLGDKIDKIRAVLLTHGHEDHISGLPFHFENLGRPPILASKLTAHFIEQKFAEKKVRPSIKQISYDTIYSLGAFRVQFIRLTHSIPDATHIVIDCPVGRFYHGSDYKLDLTPPYGKPPDFYAIAKAGKEGVKCILSDCLGSERHGLTLSESIVGSTFEELIRTTEGKFVMTTFSSNISRVRQCAEAAVKYNRLLCFLGRSMKQNTDLAKRIGYFPISQRSIIDERDVSKYSPSKICIVAAGSQGQFNSALTKLADGENKNIKLIKGDRVLFSSDPIPGNEDEVYDVIEKLNTKKIDVIYPNIQDQLHASGHGNKEDIKLLMRMVNPKYLIPIGGELRHQRQYQKIAKELGWSEEDVIILQKGDTIWFEKNKVYPAEKISLKSVYVDAYGIGDVGNVILSDRKTLGQEGVVFVVLLISQKHKLLQAPIISSRGFIYKTDEAKIYSIGKNKIQEILTQGNNSSKDKTSLERKLVSVLEKAFEKETGRRPLVNMSIIVMQ